ncbi:hypothetical protein SAMN05443665_103435 [Actinomadura meyerae]|uniref:Uncharacterized protein n=1 Tax=Actinomadura meyerae TaxID=240840 RepID=A0A239N0V4_9ACTN|nr:hypothetical protein [Actinomadura meyerae]SNT48072.1 hypothetical protein SAMN05443665_103435 [Actinomadura meyerae]
MAESLRWSGSRREPDQPDEADAPGTGADGAEQGGAGLGGVGQGGAEQGGAAPAPWGGKRPWWSAESGGTGPLPSLGTGGHPMVGGSGAFPQVGGTGGHPAVGTGGHPAVGTGGHPAVGTGGHPAVGTGGHPVVVDGTGPLPPVPPAPAPVRRRRVPRLLLVSGAAVVAAVALMAGALAFRTGTGVARDTPTAELPAPKKVITAGAVAGGLRKDALTPPRESAAYPFIAGAVEAGGVPAGEHGTAVYGGEQARKLNVLFMGGTGAVGDPAAYLRKARPTTFIAGQEAVAGGKGAKAFCGTFAVLAETHAYCAWATRDSYGFVATNRATPHPQFPLLADVMRRIRRDVERPK